MSNSDKILDLSVIEEMLYGQKDYIVEFAEAAIDSFSEFNHDFGKYLNARDFDGFQKTGHKIKPVLEILKIELLLDKYNYGKEIISEEKPQKISDKLIEEVSKMTTQIIKELSELAKLDEDSE